MIIKDTEAHILSDHNYTIEAGRITISLKYREGVEGFILCVSDLFSKRCNWNDPSLQDLIQKSLKKHQDYVLWSPALKESGENPDEDIIIENKEDSYRLFYVEEMYLKGGRIALPPSVKVPVRIQILWKDMDGDFHLEDKSDSQMIIPMELKIYKHICQVKHWFRPSEYICNATFDCIQTLQMPDDLLSYQPQNSKFEFPITSQMLRSDKSLTIHLQGKEDGISFKENPKYTNMIKIREMNAKN